MKTKNKPVKAVKKPTTRVKKTPKSTFVPKKKCGGKV
jgi:hypothetical protein